MPDNILIPDYAAGNYDRKRIETFDYDNISTCWNMLCHNYCNTDD